jgi:hypothetical protein
MYNNIFEQLQKVQNHMQNSYAMPKKLKIRALSLTPHAKYDTACPIDGRFERPWQPFF